MTAHPIESHQIHTYARADGVVKEGAAWIARFYPYETFPIFFSGDTRMSVMGAAEAFRDQIIENHAAAFAARTLATEKRRAADAEKKRKETAQ